MTQDRPKKAKIQFQMGWGGLFAILFTSICVLLWVFILGFWSGQKLMNRNAPVAQAPVQETPPQPLAKAPAPSPASPVASPPASQPEPPVTSFPSKPAPEPVEPSVQDVKPIEEQKTDHAAEKMREEPAAPVPVKPTQVPISAEKPPAQITQTVPSQAQKPVAQEAKEETKKTPEKTSPATGGTSFSLQIASFKDQAQAQAEAEKWNGKGYRAFAKKTDLGEKGVWFRVYIGKFETLDEAKAFERIIVKKEGVKTYIVSVKN